MTKYLITSALPYINGVKHLGNLAGSLLPADVHARFRRQTGSEVLFICATDEHGTPAELAAAKAGCDVAQYCERQHVIQSDIYRRLNLSFDHFGRSSSPRNHALTQHFFARLEQNGFIEERTLNQVFSGADDRFLPDRYVVGTCPYCGSDRARGDQCESCARQLDPTDLIAPRSAISGAADLEVRPTRHLFLRQTAIEGELREWLSSRSNWPPLVTSIANKWLNEGIRDRCITRDLSWGVPVPKPGFEGKVFYVWFDAPIAYIAATQEWADADPARRNWKSWWLDAPDVRYAQFLGKDNVPFHAVSFPCTLLGSREPWTTADIIKGVNWLNYEGGKFSTSSGRGIFLDQALELLPADRWRWWLTANAPENSDTDFSFSRFVTDVDHDLADTFGNFVQRVLSLVESRYGGFVPGEGLPSPGDDDLSTRIRTLLDHLRERHEVLALRGTADDVRAIWKAANAYLVARAPWTLLKTDGDQAASVVRTAVNLVGICARAAWPIIPEAAEKVLGAIGDLEAVPAFPSTDHLTRIPAGRRIRHPGPLFAKLGADWAATQRQKFTA
ncbi:methionine--tRNA ligase [Bradyrhizobium sp. BRP22]|uniref:methionine--tRNA ligase n=1 Tax=Bradyrhizobium sp. BRP22 TaxID=2793821 RepID=UPI001CD422C1|nr:methionine--tRNA ligase [Bradyrhizobium sp. BRP22]MCA1457173.1 methionine--tRNA ligase [Bradyrhizobium sp. BRP22]